MSSVYHPRADTDAWLSWVLNKINALPYKATARYAFYRLVQEYGFSKSDYKGVFLQATSKARKSFYDGWDPETFTDDTRSVLNEYGKGFDDAKAWFESQKEKKPKLDCESSQDTIVFVAFEAKAMIRQFQYYLEDWRVCLLPFGGDASIPYKYGIARLIEEASESWDKPIVVLYFGDYDKKGLSIPESAFNDIREWCSVDFDFLRVGINHEHISQFNISDNPEKPGNYQWEALEDSSAKVLIDRVFEYWSKDAITQIKDNEAKASKVWSESVDEAIKKALDEDPGDDEP